MFVSVLSFGELEKGVLRLPASKRKDRLRFWIDQHLTRRFEGKWLPVSLDVALAWGRICAKAEEDGRKRPVVDSLIAATALVHNLCVVTRNTNDLADMGVEILDPWAL